MRWVVKMFALGVAMVLLRRVAAGPLEARAALALGLLLCAAWLGAGLARRARLPQVTGFLLLGFCVGPGWLHFVRADEVDALTLIADAGLGLVTLAAGAALSVPALARERVALSRLTVGTVAFPFAAVALVTLSVARWFPLTLHQPFGAALAAALALAAVAVTSSPALTVAVMEDPGQPEEGRFTSTLLGVTALKDVVAVALLALVLALGGGVASAGAVHGGLGIGLAGRAAASLAAGAVVGVLLDHYLRLPRSDAMIALGVFAFGATVIARLLELDGTLLALTAGCIAANVSPARGARLRAAWREASLPVYAVAFTLMGAGLDLRTLADLWPWVLLLVGLRAVTLRYGTLWAGRRPEVEHALAKDGWLGLISQAGVVLALAAAVRRAFPAWGVSFETLVATMVAVHALLGPVALRRALARADAQGRDRASGLAVAGVAMLLAIALPGRLAAQTIVNDSVARSVRSAALAGAGVALVGDAASIFVNPAGIATIRRAALDGSYERRGGATTLSGAAALRVGRFDWGVGAAAVDVRAGGGASDVLGLSTLVFRFGMLALGTSLKYVEQERTGLPLHAWAGDAGVAIAVFDIAAVGASVQNLGGDFSDGTRLRRWTRAGLTMNYVDPQGAFRLLTTFEGQWPEGRSGVLTVGAEGGVVANGVGVIARAGATGRTAPGMGSPVTFGAGLILARELHLDYAFQSSDAPGAARHRFGLRWTH